MIPCICINENNKPSVIPASAWPKEGEKYHITHIGLTTTLKDKKCIQAVTLHEIKIPAEAYPYEGYKISRFDFDPKDLPKLVEMIQNCTDLSKMDVLELLKQEEVCEIE